MPSASIPSSDHCSDPIAYESASEGGDSAPARRAIQELEEQLKLRDQVRCGDCSRARSRRRFGQGPLDSGQGARGNRRARSGLVPIQPRSQRCLCARRPVLVGDCRRALVPGSLLALGRADVAAVCQSMVGLDASTMFLFWHRKLGGLQGQTLTQALQNGQLQGALHFSKTFADECLGRLPAGTWAG